MDSGTMIRETAGRKKAQEDVQTATERVPSAILGCVSSTCESRLCVVD